MNKAELIEAIASKSGLTKSDSERAVNITIEIIISQLKKGNKVSIAGLGSFERIIRAARIGVNPATGEKIKISAKKAPKFKAAKAFKDSVNVVNS